MLIRAYSDLHGLLPDIAPCDLLLLAGDVCPISGEHKIDDQREFVGGPFSEWLRSLPADRILMTPGNHDFIFESDFEWKNSPLEMLIDRMPDEAPEGLKIYGSPWVPNLPNWAFHATDQRLVELADEIPEGMDIWLQHGPPYGMLDQPWRNKQHVGNKHLLEALNTKPPKVLICGHIHEAAGYAEHNGALVANVSFVDEFYEPQFRHLALRWENGELTRDEDAEINHKILIFPASAPADAA